MLVGHAKMFLSRGRRKSFGLIGVAFIDAGGTRWLGRCGHESRGRRGGVLGLGDFPCWKVRGTHDVSNY